METKVTRTSGPWFRIIHLVRTKNFPKTNISYSLIHTSNGKTVKITRKLHSNSQSEENSLFWRTFLGSYNII